MAKDDDDRDATWRDFRDAVNMTPSELEKWLTTDESQDAGQHKGGGESVGHESGRKIVAILRTNRADHSDADHAHMRKVTGYVHRHAAQRPKGDIKDSTWRHSLMNWGHDPLKS
ncbi:DUF3140 domain-containing protein [Streptomyces sp. NPDC047117]|uniref:DUF3140 domain-containing protein n=1 Tax=Streptomyces sp. NPDC047117 TaxID=3155379 RepID=UPI0033CEB11B